MLLMPCPHCGKTEPVRIYRASEDEDFDESNDDTFAVVCEASSEGGMVPGGCGAVGGYHIREVDAIAAWNLRATYLASAPQAAQPLELDAYDAGLLSGFGGGDVDWWQDYLRAELGRAHEHYQAQVIATSPAPAVVQMTGKIIEVGDMDEGRGFAMDVGNGEYITVTRLTEDQARAVAPLYDQEVVLSLSASGVHHE